MRQAKHVKARKSRKGLYIILFALLFLAALCAVLISWNTGKNDISSPSQWEAAEAALVEEHHDNFETADPSPIMTDAEEGALLESGSNINAGFYGDYDYDGAVSDLTDKSFSVGKAGMAFDNKGQPILSDVTVFYGEDTEVKTAILYYYDDRYEIYSSSMNDLKKQLEENDFLDSVKIVLEDPNAEKLLAREITIYRFADLR